MNKTGYLYIELSSKAATSIMKVGKCGNKMIDSNNITYESIVQLL